MSPVIISILAPLFKRGGHFVASSLHFVAEGAKSRGFTRSGALGQPGEGHDLAGGVLCVISRRKAQGCGGKDSGEGGHGLC